MFICLSLFFLGDDLSRTASGAVKPTDNEHRTCIDSKPVSVPKDIIKI